MNRRSLFAGLAAMPLLAASSAIAAVGPGRATGRSDPSAKQTVTVNLTANTRYSREQIGALLTEIDQQVLYLGKTIVHGRGGL